jgi:hypothetical protein
MERDKFYDAKFLETPQGEGFQDPLDELGEDRLFQNKRRYWV